MDEVLDRDKVIDFFKAIFITCTQVEGRSIKLMPPNADSVFSKGYQIHISPNNNEFLGICIQKVAKKSELEIANEGDTLIIFNPLN
jgi:hypothetical protein